MDDYSFTLQNVEDEIVKRLGESTTQTMIDADNENRVIPLFWQSVTDIIISGEYEEEDIAGLIKEKTKTISDEVDTKGQIDLSNIGDLLRYHDVYSEPGNTDHLQFVIQKKTLNFMKSILSGDPRASGEIYMYKIGNILKFFSKDDAGGQDVIVVYVESPNPLGETDDESLLTTYSLGFIYKAIDLTVNKIKKERQ